jgi:hypothetical protein
MELQSWQLASNRAAKRSTAGGCAVLFVLFCAAVCLFCAVLCCSTFSQRQEHSNLTCMSGHASQQRQPASMPRTAAYE